LTKVKNRYVEIVYYVLQQLLARDYCS